MLPIQKRLKVRLVIGCWSPCVKERSLTSHPDQKLTAMVTSDQINPHLCILSDQTEDRLNIPVNKRHINLQGLPTAHLCRKNGLGTLAKKNGKCGNFFKKKRGGLPKSHFFCNLTKCILACQIHSEVLKHVLQKGRSVI